MNESPPKHLNFEDKAGDYAESQADLCEHYGTEFFSEYVEFEDFGKVHCLITGDPEEEPVFFVHGGDTTAAVWFPLVAELGGYRMYMFDAPGLGLSSPFEYWDVDIRSMGVRLITGLVDHFGHDSATLVAHSFGGYWALSTALDRPEYVDSLAFMSAPLGTYEDFPKSFRLMSLPILDRFFYRIVFGGLNQTGKEQRKKFERIMINDGSHLPDSLFECLAATNRISHSRRARRSITRSLIGLRGIPDRFILLDEIPSIDAQTLFIWGDDDTFSPNQACREAASMMTNAECNVLDRCRHAVWLEEGNEVSEKLSSFLG